MKTVDIIRAWKDPEYRQSLNDKDRALLPEHPSGTIDLTDDQLDAISGGLAACTCKCCCCTC